jgi:hypothetical protein
LCRISLQTNFMLQEKYDNNCDLVFNYTNMMLRLARVVTPKRFYSSDVSLWEAVIGIEVHAQLHVDHKLLSQTPLFSSIVAPSAHTSGDHYRFETSSDHALLLNTAAPNTLLGFADTAQPGALPSNHSPLQSILMKINV